MKTHPGGASAAGKLLFASWLSQLLAVCFEQLAIAAAVARAAARTRIPVAVAVSQRIKVDNSLIDDAFAAACTPTPRHKRTRVPDEDDSADFEDSSTSGQLPAVALT